MGIKSWRMDFNMRARLYAKNDKSDRYSGLPDDGRAFSPTFSCHQRVSSRLKLVSQSVREHQTTIYVSTWPHNIPTSCCCCWWLRLNCWCDWELKARPKRIRELWCCCSWWRQALRCGWDDDDGDGDGGGRFMGKAHKVLYNDHKYYM